MAGRKQGRPHPAISPVRQQLVEHLQSVARKRATVAQFGERWRRLEEFKQAEADARARVEEIRQREARQIAEQLSASTGAIQPLDHETLKRAERELARATRDADAARACESAIVEQSTAATQDLTSANQRTPAVAAAVAADEAAAIVAEIDAGVQALRCNIARLRGLRAFLGGEPDLRRLLGGGIPVHAHIDQAWPELSEVARQEEAWRSYARRLACDPDAEFKE